MAKQKPPILKITEMEALLQGMDDLLRDEYGNPLPPNHPQYLKLTQKLNQLNANIENLEDFPDSGSPRGNA